MVLCSLPDVGVALAEARWVLKADGQIRSLEHVRADTRVLARAIRGAGRRAGPRLPRGR
ncbi:hypothetical protein FHU36_004486 [Nonomuraea muscovyensis]|uniref:Uncharacterized protein n=2 Tax=Nonomuraea muscovyensis TaxID=1124761 RepID=A0A7X0C5C8_9ACTN|nr:hypothetical protein [Nonomuraea muscovyensis]